MDAKDLTRQVFLSYARKEQPLAEAVSKLLAQRGIKVLEGRSELRAGDDWASSVNEALRKSDSMIALLTPNSFSSSFVRSELDHALFDDRFKHRVLPVLIGNARDDFVRLPWILSRMQVLELSPDSPAPQQARRITDEFERMLLSSKVQE
jgi:hypothetical protein